MAAATASMMFGVAAPIAAADDGTTAGAEDNTNRRPGDAIRNVIRNSLANVGASGNVGQSGRNLIFSSNSRGLNLAFLGNGNTNSGTNELGGLGTGDNLVGINAVLVGNGTSDPGRNIVTGNNARGINLALIGNGAQNSGNNTGGGINIAIVPANSVNVGNCSKSVCVNILGLQLLGG